MYIWMKMGYQFDLIYWNEPTYSQLYSNIKIFLLKQYFEYRFENYSILNFCDVWYFFMKVKIKHEDRLTD